MHREIEYELKAKNADGKKAPYSGKVKLKLLPFKERNKLMKSLNIKADQANAALNDNLDMLDKLADITKENMIAMSVCKGDKNFETLDELDYDENVSEFYTEVGMVIVSGINLGKI